MSSDSIFLSLNRFFYVLARAKDGFKINSSIERQGVVHFELFLPHDLLAMTDESNKIVNFYSVGDFLNPSNTNKLPNALH